MSKHLENKKMVMEYNNSIYGSTPETIEKVISKYYSEDIDWRGPQPFNEIKGSKHVIDKFWKPFISSFPNLKKEAYVHMAGNDPLFPENDWVLTSGNYIGIFEHDFLNIPATNEAVWVRYMEYNRIVDGKIIQTYTLIDILDLMRQAGIKFITSLSPEIIVPGPATHDGVMMGECNTEESQKTFDLAHSLCWKSLTSFKDKGVGKMGMEKYWDKNFMWYGPCGIGCTIGVKGFENGHQKPFLKAIPDRKYPERVVEEKDTPFFAEGNYATYIWWTGFNATHTGNDWLGVPATGKPIVMRCADIYRREGDYLFENWVLLDIIDILLQMGVDVFDRLKRNVYTIHC